MQLLVYKILTNHIFIIIIKKTIKFEFELNLNTPR